MSPQQRGVAIGLAVAVVAALATLGGLRLAQGSSATARLATPPGTTAATEAPSTSAPTLAPSTTRAATTVARGGPVPPGFGPASVTFVSASEGFLLGSAPCQSPPCTSIVRTTDDGRTWEGVPAPAAVLGQGTQGGGGQVSRFRMADGLDGFVFGPELWVTHDGVQTWHQVRVPGDVLDLAATNGYAYAVIAPSCSTPSCSVPVALYRTPIHSDAWTPIPGAATTAAEGGGSLSFTNLLSFHGNVGYLFLPSGRAAPMGQFLTTSDGGVHWRPVPLPCSGQDDVTFSFAAVDDHTVVELCSGSAGGSQSHKTAFESTANGQAPRPLGPVPWGGDGGEIAASNPSTIIVASTSAASLLYISSDGGRTWRTVYADNVGAGLYDLGFTTSTQGVVVHGHPQFEGAESATTPNELLMTTDGGATWHPTPL